MDQKKKDSILIEKIMQSADGLDAVDGKILKNREKALELISRSEEALQSFFEKFPSSKIINIQDSLPRLSVPDTKQINKVPEEIFFYQDDPISGYIQISRDEILVFKDDALKKEPRIILDGFAQGLKLHPDIASQIFAQSAASGEEVLSAFCASTSRHGVLVYIPEGYHVINPLMIEVNADSFSGQVTPLYFLFLIDKNASADILLKIRNRRANPQPSFFAIQLEGLLNRSSRLNLFETQNLSNQDDLAFSEVINISENASLNYLGFDSGGLYVDRQLKIVLGEEKGEAQITGLYKPGKHSTFLLSTSQAHNASITKSDLLYKGVLSGEARVNWNGNIFVKRDTQGVDGYQMNNNLLTSDKVHINSIPGLEILTDDVRCSHGVTISNIDENQRLYLQSRGVSQKESEQLIIEGFFQKALERIGDSIIGRMIKRELPGSINADF